ncbi:hypothetical protein [Streptomyces sp. MST-110588]|uniref:hypothetical protein n=1 Tax=Streptomyces sp. MST-110588 TaxID=2833628 RepID=UPI001F5D0776|nr:hypothetical protein [Streptomyces sp. MST-110588]UNO39422.1 hypothetical protein KGS77_07150 [Streptomyces sp. MST-110588]
MFAFPADAEEVHDAVGGETVTHGDVTITAPDRVTISFHHVLADEPDEEDSQIHDPSRMATERLKRTLNLLHRPPRQLSTVRQYATGELALVQVVGPEDFKPKGGPERELRDVVDNLRHRHGGFARWRFDWARGAK